MFYVNKIEQQKVQPTGMSQEQVQVLTCFRFYVLCQQNGIAKGTAHRHVTGFSVLKVTEGFMFFCLYVHLCHTLCQNTEGTGTGTDVFYVLCQPHVVAKGTTHRHATGTGTGMPYFILEYRRHRYRYTHACRRNRNRYRNRTYDYYVVT